MISEPARPGCRSPTNSGKSFSESSIAPSRMYAAVRPRPTSVSYFTSDDFGSFGSFASRSMRRPPNIFGSIAPPPMLSGCFTASGMKPFAVIESSRK